MITTTCLVLAGWLSGPSSLAPAEPYGGLTVDWRAETHVDTIQLRRLGFPQGITLARSWEGEPLTFEELEPGTYAVEGRGVWWHAGVRVTVRAGQTREVVFEPEPMEFDEEPVLERARAICASCGALQRTGASRPSTISRVGQ